MHNQDMRRMRRRGLPAERISRAEIFERDGMLCHLCYLPITGKPTIDHIIPIATPGSPGHVWENLAAAHSTCNSGKRDRVRPEDWTLYEELRLRRPVETGKPSRLTA
jgi:5-methylcytosine-specific restriction endonuclease McrA